MASSADGTPWGLLGIAGVLSFCCIGTATLVGGAAVAGGTAAGTSVVSGTTGGLGGILASALGTAVPLIAIGLVLRWRADDD